MNKTVIVTGASSGIGKASAKLFADNGYNVVLNSITESNLMLAYDEIGRPEQIKMVAGDIGNRDTAKKIADFAMQHFGRIDVLINNAGIFLPKPFLEVEESDLDRLFKNNFKGTYFMSQYAVKEMIESGGGDIINIGSVLVDHSIAGLPATGAISIKGAIHTFTRQLAAEFGKQKIRVNTIAPGVIRTPLQDKLGVTDFESLKKLSLLHEIGHANDVAQVAFLLANNAFMTGTVINVDGGHVAGH